MSSMEWWIAKMNAHDFNTRIGRVQVSWLLEAVGFGDVIATLSERAAVQSAHDGESMTAAEIAALRCAVARMARGEAIEEDELVAACDSAEMARSTRDAQEEDAWEEGREDRRNNPDQ